ncbi:hypothetical protein CYLTODRAFT_472568 [Cylindrobasidium torrendii FP15055 ss-10]|uniref:Neutral trehalase Ca2+ binding domain-containing protein n=1 Tax=Cylindrobasidium torrendii FP15055 ss-10 TaxID=1314674 RepID=A0A0D7B0K8_9AGAR|nr:hypothetical protein CYLTODRAFT_472568 [Cylindrobasidium torrendii FP15055 ss-10]
MASRRLTSTGRTCSNLPQEPEAYRAGQTPTDRDLSRPPFVYDHPRFPPHLVHLQIWYRTDRERRMANIKVECHARTRCLSHNEKNAKGPRRFLLDVEETIRVVLEQEDTDGDFQISVADADQKAMAVGTATSNGFETFDICGTYGIAQTGSAGWQTSKLNETHVHDSLATDGVAGTHPSPPQEAGVRGGAARRLDITRMLWGGSGAGEIQATPPDLQCDRISTPYICDMRRTWDYQYYI